jgi:two-component system sensor histidine kinase YesM
MKRRSIRKRLMIIMICMATLPVIIVTWIATNKTGNTVETEIINANTSRMIWADQYLNELTNEIDSMFYTLQINQNFMNSLDKINDSDIGVEYIAQNYIRDALTSSFYANSRKIEEISLYEHSSKKVFSIDFASSGNVSFLDIGKGSWSRIQKMPINVYFKQSRNGIYAFHSINRFEDQKLLGGLSARINSDVWEEVSTILKSEADSSVFLINDEGEMLSGSSKTGSSSEIQMQLSNLNLQNSQLEVRRTKNYLYFMKRIGDGRLTIVKAMPLEVIFKSAQATMTAGIWTGIMFTLISIILSILVSLRISKPIISLAKTMSKAQIQSFEKKTIEDNDEIGMLESGYNSMMQRIKELIENEYQREIQLKDAQLMALQAQINPHFLNNTLQLIGGIALSKNAPEIYKITGAVGDLFRYSISDEGDLVSLKDELKHMENYLFIQEQRFHDRCKVEILTDEMLLDYKLPKFTLQPIVENAFEHGLHKKEGKWRVEIRVMRIGNKVIIMIKDDGVGFTEEGLTRIRAELKDRLSLKIESVVMGEQKERKRIGLRNVHSRLKLQFGDKYNIKIYSKQGKGTMILLVLP